jgi:hypothetical protein
VGINMQIKEHFKGLYTSDIDLNINDIKNSCMFVYKSILNDDSLELAMPENSPLLVNYQKSVAAAGVNYNFFSLPYPGIYDLYWKIREVFYIAAKTHYGVDIKRKYFIHAWLNVYEKNEFLDWHSHPNNDVIFWHGFYCVNTEPSKTSYKLLNDTKEIIDIECINNRIVLSPLSGELHRTWPWTKDHDPRITIAFNITTDNSIIKNDVSFQQKANFNSFYIPI